MQQNWDSKNLIFHFSTEKAISWIVNEWYDNKPVNMAFNLTSFGQMDTCNRWSKQEKTYIEINSPEVVKLYIENMDGVYKLEFIITVCGHC